MSKTAAKSLIRTERNGTITVLEREGNATSRVLIIKDDNYVIIDCRTLKAKVLGIHKGEVVDMVSAFQQGIMIAADGNTSVLIDNRVRVTPKIPKEMTNLELYDFGIIPEQWQVMDKDQAKSWLQLAAGAGVVVDATASEVVAPRHPSPTTARAERTV